MSDDLDPIPFSPPSVTEDDIERVVAVLRSRWLSTGAVGLELEERLAERLGAPHVVAMSSCTAALEISLRSLRLAPGTRVGVPAWTFVASASSIVHAGGVPVLLDVEPDTLNLSPAAVEAAIASGIEGLVLVHFAGAPVDASIRSMAADAGIPVVEDAAHALGTTDERGEVSGAGSVSACFSFYATKNLTSAEGGALVTHDAELARYARSQRLHGLSNDAWDRYRVGGATTYDMVEPGLKANLPDLLAALACSQLDRFDEMQAQRRRLVERYRAGLADVDGIGLLRFDDRSADHLMVVLLDPSIDRSLLVKELAAAGIGTGIHFRPLHRFSWFEANAPLGPGGVPVSEALADHALSLPLHAELQEAQVDRVLEVLAGTLP